MRLPLLQRQLQLRFGSCSRFVISAIPSTGAPCSDARMDLYIHVEKRGGREVGYDNRLEQILVLRDRGWACLDDARVLSYMGLSLKGASSREGNDRPLCIHHVPVIRAPDRRSGRHVSSVLGTTFHPPGDDAATSSCGPAKQLEGIMKWCAQRCWNDVRSLSSLRIAYVTAGAIFHGRKMSLHTQTHWYRHLNPRCREWVA